MTGSFRQRVLLKKPLRVIWAEEDQSESSEGRVLSLFDLICIGVGGTLGSGVFVLTGVIAAQQAGAAVALCWFLSAVACTISALSYMEMSVRIPSGGSCYAYSYAALGELPAVIAAAFLTLEYGISCSAVARSWGDKFVYSTGIEWLEAGQVSIVAGLLTAACMGVLLVGLQLGKRMITFFTVTKVGLVLFMTVVGFMHFSKENFLHPFIPPPGLSREGTPAYGWAGVLRGTSMAFFGYIGFDEVCCLSAQSRNPTRVMPVAVVLTVLITAVLSILAAAALTGMVPYYKMGSDFGFAVALKMNGATWSAAIVEAGELLTLLVVVLVSFLAQPHLQAAMARDGLLPGCFNKHNSKGVLTWNLLITGGVLSTVAMFVPFDNLNDMINAGVLLSLNMTNACVVLLRRRAAWPNHSEERAASRSAGHALAPWLLLLYSVLTALAGLAATKLQQLVVTSFLCGAAAIALGLLIILCPQEKDEHYHGFKVPLEPVLPCAGIAINFYLVAQLEVAGLLLIAAYTATAVVGYLLYGYWNSVGQRTAWGYHTDDFLSHPSA
eukprot:CAMPEP_0118930936 /NCGR_PEP_ID=MMETSP1169-20130426/7453_1 /TAXON_ID=36882 /ORGANISM="Pyramimonas obovata, Strain CCMP722" /LENGTH=551 /DNA_ID=CAMNT_0006873369 /DNA_START=429 /DNA_END=2080 /DNA_ORIENTATION=-